MIRRTKFDEDYKRKIGLELASGVSSAGEISKREGIHANTLYKWRDKYVDCKVSSEEGEIIALKKQIKDLEETVSDQALQIFILKKTQKIMEQLKKRERSSGSISPQILESKKIVRR